MPWRTSLPVNFPETSLFESSQEMRRKGLVKAPNLSLESFLPFRGSCDITHKDALVTACLEEKIKREENWVASHPRQNVLFPSRRWGEKRQHHDTPLLHLTSQLLSLPSVSGGIRALPVCFVLSFWRRPLNHNPVFDAIFLSSFLPPLSHSFLSQRLDTLRCFLSFLLSTPRDLCVPWCEKFPLVFLY